MQYPLGTDVGGTLTNFVAYDEETKSPRVWKDLSTPAKASGRYPDRAQKLRRRKRNERACDLGITVAARGHWLRIASPDGGGWGPQSERERDRVAEDVREGFVSAAQARHDGARRKPRRPTRRILLRVVPRLAFLAESWTELSHLAEDMTS